MPRRYKPKRKPLWKKGIFWKGIFLLMTALGLAYFFLLSPIFEIEKIEVKGVKKIQKEEVKRLIKPQENFFLFSSKNLERILKETFVLVQLVKIEKKFPDGILIEIEERKPQAIICEFKKQDEAGTIEKENEDKSLKKSTEKECFLVSLDGVVFEKNGSIANDPQLILIELSQGNGQLQIGKEVLEKKIMEGLVLAREMLDGLGIGLEKATLEKDKISMLASFGFEIYFSKEVNFKPQIYALISALKEGIDKEKWISLRYIDLRAVEEGGGGKIYFK